jgi:hypothetical protein
MGAGGAPSNRRMYLLKVVHPANYRGLSSSPGRSIRRPNPRRIGAGDGRLPELPEEPRASPSPAKPGAGTRAGDGEAWGRRSRRPASTPYGSLGRWGRASRCSPWCLPGFLPPEPMEGTLLNSILKLRLERVRIGRKREFHRQRERRPFRRILAARRRRDPFARSGNPLETSRLPLLWHQNGRRWKCL